MADQENKEPVDCNQIELETKDKSTDSGDASTVAAKLTGQLMTNPNVLAAFEQKLGSMVGRSSGYIDSLPKSIKRRIKALKKLQSEFFNAESKFFEELHELDRKYSELYRPMYEKRRDIVNATKEPTDSECEWASDEEEVEEVPKAKIVEIDETEFKEENGIPKSIFDENTKGIPEFWLTTFKNVEAIAALVEEHDEPVLKSLHDICVKQSSNGTMGFTLEFLFGPNDYFTNAVLTKEYFMRSTPDPEHPLLYEGPEIVKCRGCTIDWKKGKNVTVKSIKQKQKGRGGGAKKMVTKTVKCESFFSFFSPPEVKENEDDDDEENQHIQEVLMNDYEVGQLLQESVIPKAVLYFTGDALDSGDEDDQYDYGEGDEEGEGDDEDPDYKPPKGGKDGPPECKQQ